MTGHVQRRTSTIVGAFTAVAVLGSGCSWLLQDRLHGGVTSYEARSEPHCSMGRGWPGLDTLFAAFGAISIAAGASAGEAVSSETKTAWIVGGIASLIIHGGSAMTGYRWAGECHEAFDIWGQTASTVPVDERRRAQLARQFASNPTNDPNKAAAFWCGPAGGCTAEESTCAGTCVPRENAWCAHTDHGFLCGRNRTACLSNVDDSGARPKSECVERRAALWAGPAVRQAPIEPRLAATPPAPKPRGHFCATSAAQPAASVCAREKPDCQTARDAAIAVVADLGDCTLIETAHCFDAEGRERCFYSLDACSARAGGAACNARN